MVKIERITDESEENADAIYHQGHREPRKTEEDDCINRGHEVNHRDWKECFRNIGKHNEAAAAGNQHPTINLALSGWAGCQMLIKEKSQHPERKDRKLVKKTEIDEFVLIYLGT